MINVTSEGIAVSDVSTPGFSEFLGYWNELCRDRFAPTWDDVELFDLPAKLLPYLTVVEVAADVADFVFRFCGTAHMTTKTRDYTALSVRSIRPENLAEVIFEQYRRTVEAREPMAFVRTIHGFSEDQPLSQINLRMPLSDDGDKVTGVISLAHWQHQLGLRAFYMHHGRGLQRVPVAEPELRLQASQ